MKRKSSSEEEKARDLLYEFFISRRRAPLQSFLRLYSAERLLRNGGVERLLVQTEVPANLGSRADLVVANDSDLLFVEVKIDAVEKVGQYEKYKHFFERQGYVVIAGGLVERTRTARSKDNIAFLDALGVRRLTWSELLGALQDEFGQTEEFKQFIANLRQVRSTIGSKPSVVVDRAATASKDRSDIAASNHALADFYKELVGLLSPMEGRLWQYGNPPYCLAFGKPSWGTMFQESWFQRAFICCEKKIPSEPAFVFGVMLWNRTWTKNKIWFEQHRNAIAEYFACRGFDVGRNTGSSWHRREAWLPPYDTKGLKYANALWSARIPLTTCGHAPMPWNDLLATSARKCKELARILDELNFYNVMSHDPAVPSRILSLPAPQPSRPTHR
jgi:hypothetical protein